MAGARKKPNKVSGKYQGYFMDHTGKRRFFIGTKSRRQTICMAQKLEDEATQVRHGYKPAPTAAARHRSRPFLEVVQEHIAWGRTFGRRDGKPWATEHADRKLDYLTKWAETLSLESLADVEGILPRVEAVLRELADMGLSSNTLGRRAQALASFFNWCVIRGYLSQNPLANLQTIDATPETERRALTVDEIARLFSIAPLWRQLVYAVALTTGLRKRELRRLDRADLDVKNNRLCLQWRQTKNKKPAVQYLPAKLVEQLVVFADSGKPARLYEKAQGQYALPSNPLLFVPSHILRSLNKDLERVGIDKVTREGRMDFHALRAAFVTLGAEAGANPKELQAMARHADPRLTFNTYARQRDPRMAELAERIGGSLPAVKCATGVHREGEGLPNALSNRALCKDGLCPGDTGPSLWLMRFSRTIAYDSSHRAQSCSSLQTERT